MQKKPMTIGSFEKDSDIPRYTDGRCVLSVPVISSGTPQDIALADNLRRKYLNARADEIYEACAALSVSQLDAVFQHFSAAGLSELVYGFVTSGERFLLTLSDARAVIDEVVRCRDYHFRLNASDLPELKKT